MEPLGVVDYIGKRCSASGHLWRFEPWDTVIPSGPVGAVVKSGSGRPAVFGRPEGRRKCRPCLEVHGSVL